MGPWQKPRNRQKEAGGYQECKREIIDPMPNEWLVQYTKPRPQLKRRPNQRYKSRCGRILNKDIDQILATLGGELERFRNETVALLKEGMGDEMEIGKTDDMGSKF